MLALDTVASLSHAVSLGMNRDARRAPPAPLEIAPMSSLGDVDPPRREWTWDGWIPAGRVTALAADGGVGKSLLAQMLATAVSVDRDLFGIGTAHGTVVGLFCEDELAELIRRQRAINSALGLDMASLDRLHLVSRMGEENLLVAFRDHVAIPTELYARLDATCAALKPHLLVIDPAADVYGGNMVEQIEVRQFVQTILGGLCKRHGCAVLLPIHPSAAGISSGEGMGFSVAWNNAVRSRLYLAHPKLNGESLHDRATLTRKKSNYSSKGEALNLLYHDAVWQLDPDPPSASAEVNVKPSDAEAYATLLALGANGNSYVKLADWMAACDARGVFPGGLEPRTRQKQMERIANRLLAAKLALRSPMLRGMYRAIRASDPGQA